jgi:hypothetical protein
VKLQSNTSYYKFTFFFFPILHRTMYSMEPEMTEYSLHHKVILYTTFFLENLFHNNLFPKYVISEYWCYFSALHCNSRYSSNPCILVFSSEDINIPWSNSTYQPKSGCNLELTIPNFHQFKVLIIGAVQLYEHNIAQLQQLSSTVNIPFTMTFPHCYHKCENSVNLSTITDVFTKWNTK